jgi:DNA-directed RNA polymerase subunit E'/Rpb7
MLNFFCIFCYTVVDGVVNQVDQDGIPITSAADTVMIHRVHTMKLQVMRIIGQVNKPAKLSMLILYTVYST